VIRALAEVKTQWEDEREREYPAAPGRIFGGSWARRASREVRLTDLIRPSKAQKSRVPESDFEVVPHVRSVIVLDDFAETGEAELDEPWEHLSSESEEEGKKALSYAEIVSKAK